MFSTIFKWCSGRHTLFAAFFAISGTALQYYHRLDMNYIALVTAVQGLVLAHSAKEDYTEYKNNQLQSMIPAPPVQIPDQIPQAPNLGSPQPQPMPLE
jgi:hypothetical protein